MEDVLEQVWLETFYNVWEESLLTPPDDIELLQILKSFSLCWYLWLAKRVNDGKRKLVL